MSEIVFKPSEASKELFARLYDKANDVIADRFFELCATEGDPRRAGSMAAHVYIRNAAKIAVFGARCAGLEPDADLWRGVCDAAFAGAIKDVGAVFDAPAEVPET